MVQFILKLNDEVERSLREIESNETDILKHAELSIMELEQAFVDLKTFTVSYTFASKEDEIRFFKEIKPQLFCRLIYYRKLYNIEMNRPKGGEDEQRDYLKRQLCRLNDYFNCNREFYKYYRSNETHMDEHYFLRKKPTIQLTMESFYFERDPRFSTAADFKMAKVIGNDMVEEYLNGELERIAHRHENGGMLIKEKLTWTEKKVFLIELIYALFLAKVFNHGKVTLKDIQNYFEDIFNVDLGSNPYKGYGEMRNRKERMSFLGILKKLLKNKMDNDDEK